MSLDDKPTTFEEALSRFLENEPEPGDGELIARVIRESPEKLRVVSGLLAVDDLMRQHAEPKSDSFVEAFEERLKADASMAPFVRRVESALDLRLIKSPTRFWRWLPWFVSAAACIIATLSLWRGSPSSPESPVVNTKPEVAIRVDDSLALMVNQAEAIFEAGASPDAVSFGTGRYHLIQGAAHLRFRNGTDVVIVAPTRFIIRDALRVEVEEGSLRALVPPAAHGFVIAAPGIRFRDLGTEFGVTVKPSGQSEMHVFEGQVEVLKENTSKPEATYTTGQSVRVDEGVLKPAEAASESEFPTASSISMRRWNAWRERFKRDTNLVFYFPFIRDDRDAAALNDEAEHGTKIVGRISGAQWVAGRWPGKSALQFENANDGVSLTIPGQYEQITLASWLKIDRIENASNAILNSVGWREGGIQWQFDRRSSTAVTSAFSVPKRTVVWTGLKLPIGRWVHWAVTMDRKSGEIRHYISGTLACVAHVTPETTILKPSAATIGRWISDNKAFENRDFRGRIDEMAMWNVALSPAQISELSEAGAPVELPDVTGIPPKGLSK